MSLVVIMGDEKRLDRQPKRATRILKSKDRPLEENQREEAVRRRGRSAEFWKKDK